MQPIRLTLATLLGLLIVAAAVAVLWDFIPALCWALIVSIVVWPFFRYWKIPFKHRNKWAAFSLTVLLALIIVMPIYSILRLLIEEGQVFLLFLRDLDQHGISVPVWLHRLPLGDRLVMLWQDHLLRPGISQVLLSSVQLPIQSTGAWLAQIGSSLAHGVSTLFFMLIFVFFFLCEGDRLLAELNNLGKKYLSSHWETYWRQLSCTTVATVNGTVMLGIALGFIMGLVYWLVGLPGPALAGSLTAVLAMVPFGAILMFAIMGMLAYLNSGMVALLVVLVVGITLNLLADHVVRPILIGNSAQLSFLAILFGILGGVSLLGLLGLFLGPMIMAMFLSLYRSLIEP